MTKQATVELLKQQLPGFYSVEQVIKMINDIEDDSQAEAYNENQLEEIADEIYDEVHRVLSNMYTGDLIDTGTAEFSLCDKTIELDSVEVDTDSIVDTVIEQVKKVMWGKFLPKVTQEEVAA